MNGEVGRRRAESVLVITGLIGETSGADVDEDGNQPALERPATLENWGRTSISITR